MLSYLKQVGKAALAAPATLIHGASEVIGVAAVGIAKTAGSLDELVSTVAQTNGTKK